MFTKKITISSSKDISTSIEGFQKELSTASLSPEITMFLKEQVTASLLQFQQQLSIATTHRINAERVLEGDGYKITLRIVFPEKSGLLMFFKKIFRLF